jgi:hypothetical protein
MPENRGTETVNEAPHIDWTKMAAQFWGPLAPAWPGLFNPFGDQEKGPSGGRMDDALRSSAALWQALFGSSTAPAALDSFMKAAQVAPDIAFGVGQTCLQTFAAFQQQVQAWIGKRAAAGAAMDTQDLDKAFIREWTETYQNELSRYLKIPQIGLTRFHQERALAVADAFNVLQVRMAEFSHMLYLPMEKSFNALQAQMVEMAKAGPVDEKPKTYYNLWIKLLEAQYMTLFQQPEYSAVMGRTLEAVHEFSAARQALIDDLLKMAAIPTQKELDELYKEIHQLKKRMRAYEKKT